MLTLTVLPQEQHELLLTKIERLERLIQLVASRDELTALNEVFIDGLSDLGNTAKEVDLYIGEHLHEVSQKVERTEGYVINSTVSMLQRFEEVYARMGVRRIEDKLNPGKFILCPIAPQAKVARRKKGSK